MPQRLIWRIISRQKGLPFRDAHEVVGSAVALGVSKGVDLSELSLDELKAFSPLISDDVFDCLTLEGSLNARNHIGVLPQSRW